MKKTIIFDLDGTVFDTDKLRVKRSNLSFTVEDYKKFNEIPYVPGFKKVFFDKNSKLFLENFNVLIVTSGYYAYSDALLNSHADFKKYINFGVIRTSGKINSIKTFLRQNNIQTSEVFCFGDDEKDAITYTDLGLKFYLVNKQEGYQSIEEILKKIDDSLNNFRSVFLYDVKRIRNNKYCNGFSSNYFDDIVIYFRNYNVTKSLDGLFGGDRCPSEGNRQVLKKFDRFEFGKSNKNDTIKSGLNFFSSSLSSLEIEKDTILARVPGHDELTYNAQHPMSILIEKVILDHGCGINGCAILNRYKLSTESKTGDRSIQKHFETIQVLRTIPLVGKTIYLFDDLFTSGTSIIACAELLYRAGAGRVICVCLARTCGRTIAFDPVTIN